MQPETKNEIIKWYWNRRVATPGMPYNTPSTVWSKFSDWRKGFNTMVNAWPQEQPSELEKSEKLDI